MFSFANLVRLRDWTRFKRMLILFLIWSTTIRLLQIKMSCEPRSGSTKSLTRLDQSTLIFVTLMILPLIQKIQKEMRPSFLTKTTSANLPAKLEPLFDHMYENLAATRLSQGRTSWTRSPSEPTEWETSFCDLESATCEILKNFCFNKIFWENLFFYFLWNYGLTYLEFDFWSCLTEI